MKNQDTIAREWAESFPAGGYRDSGRTLEADGTIIGTTWAREPLAEYLPRGRGRSRPLFVLTGDRWRSPGWGHPSVQDSVRGAIARAAPAIGADVLIVPFSALAGAGIDRATIRPLEIRPDANWNEYERVPDEIDLDDLESAAASDIRDEAYGHDREVIGRRYVWRADGHSYSRSVYLRRFQWKAGGPGGYVDVDDPEPTSPYRDRSTKCEPDPDRPGKWRAVLPQHRLGDSLFTAEVTTIRRRRRHWTVADVVRSAVGCVAAERFELARYRTGARSDITPASRLLAAVDVTAPIVETETVRRRRRFVSSFDRNERFPGLYFLATCPGSSRARTVESALEDLAPAAVHAAILRGRDVVRQGDIFAIATDLADETVYALARRRARLTQWIRDARPRPGEVGYRAPLTAENKRRFRSWRRRRFWSVYREAVRQAESHETTRAAPHTPVGDRGRRRKRRKELVRIIAHHRADARAAVLRGDAYRARTARRHLASYLATAIPSRYPDARDAYRRLYGRNAHAAWIQADTAARAHFGIDPVYRRGELERIRETLSIHGTAHSATEVVRAPGGRIYVRGIMRHVPTLEPGRNGGRDHVDVPLGDRKTWYLTVRNTVPRMADTDRR